MIIELKVRTIKYRHPGDTIAFGSINRWEKGVTPERSAELVLKNDSIIEFFVNLPSSRQAEKKSPIVCFSEVVWIDKCFS